ncbi:hypothetical protein [Nitrososphaera viennensis]|nr:hypothetical protein [Nitrososphaera viennensis]
MERLTPVDANIIRKNDEKSLKSLLPKLQDRIAARVLLKGMNNTIDSILKAKREKIESTFDDSLDSFIIMAGGLVELVAKNNRTRMIEIIQSDIAFYDNVKTDANRRADLDDKVIEDIVRMISILEDYQNVIIAIQTNRPKEFDKALEQIDGLDLLKSLYGTMLAIFCIAKLLNNKKHRDTGKLETLVQQGLSHAENLDAYTDTMDILSNPEEVALLKEETS